MAAVLAHHQAQSQGPKARRVKPGSPEEMGISPVVLAVSALPPVQVPNAASQSMSLAKTPVSRFGFPGSAQPARGGGNPSDVSTASNPSIASVPQQQPLDSQISPMKAARRAFQLGSGVALSSDSVASWSDDHRSVATTTGKSLRSRAKKATTSSSKPVSEDAEGLASSERSQQTRRPRAARTASSSTSAPIADSSAAAPSTLDTAPAPPMSTAEIAKLTKRNTRINEVYMAMLDKRPVQMEGRRPASPTSKIKRVDSTKQEKRERADRAKSRTGNSESESSDEEESGKDASASDDDESLPLIGMTEYFNRHTKGAGEEERFETPPRVTSRKGKGVRWHKSLFLGPSEAPANLVAEPENRPAVADVDLKRNRPRKSCVGKVSQMKGHMVVIFQEVSDLPLSNELTDTCSFSLSPSTDGPS